MRLDCHDPLKSNLMLHKPLAVAAAAQVPLSTRLNSLEFTTSESGDLRCLVMDTRKFRGLELIFAERDGYIIYIRCLIRNTRYIDIDYRICKKKNEFICFVNSRCIYITVYLFLN